MKTGKSIVELAREIARLRSLKRDFVADSRTIDMQLVFNDVPLLNLRGSDERFEISQNAHDQIAAHLGIPSRYYSRMMQESPELLARNVNHWLSAGDSRRMVRTLDGKVRAFLSDRYKRIEHEQILEAVIPALAERPGQTTIQSCEITESRLYMKAVFPRIEGEVKKGDIVQAGVSISNSETGGGAFVVRPLFFRLVCTNGMVAEVGGNDGAIRRTHIGRRVEADDDGIAYSDEAMAADDKALALRMRDAVRHAMDPQRFQEYIARMQAAASSEVVVKPVRAVEELSKVLPLSAAEGESVLENLIRDGDYSKWGMLNAVTKVANTAEDYDRASDLEQWGGRILALSPSEWHRIAVAA